MELRWLPQAYRRRTGMVVFTMAAFALLRWWDDRTPLTAHFGQVLLIGAVACIVPVGSTGWPGGRTPRERYVRRLALWLLIIIGPVLFIQLSQ